MVGISQGSIDILTLCQPQDRAQICKLFRSPGIDLKDSNPPAYVAGPVRQPYTLFRSALLHRLAESIPRLLGSLHVYKFELWVAGQHGGIRSTLFIFYHRLQGGGGGILAFTASKTRVDLLDRMPLRIFDLLSSGIPHYCKNTQIQFQSSNSRNNCTPTDLFVNRGDGCNVGGTRFESLHQQVRAGQSRLFILNPAINPLAYLWSERTFLNSKLDRRLLSYFQSLGYFLWLLSNFIALSLLYSIVVLLNFCHYEVGCV